VSGFAEGYIDVAARIEAFYDKYPDGSLQMEPYEWVTVDGAMFIQSRAWAYRTPDDTRPGVGTAWEKVPGSTPYTRGSELMNLETSCWGRALAALGVATRQGIATTQDVAQAQDRQAAPARGSTPQLLGPATEPQLRKLRYEMKRSNTPEHLLSDFAKDAFGWETPPDGLEKLSKAQASQLIEALTKVTQPVTRSKPTAPDPNDPWAQPSVLIDPETGEIAT
jgi:hypothetical protein